MRRALPLGIPLGLSLLVTSRSDGPPPGTFDFRYDVLPVLHRQGCASAYCHGSATGRGGFKLSLFASDPDADYRAITQDLDGRRLDLSIPAHSLLLRKPTRDTRHGGGKKLDKDSPAHRALVDWIAKGAPYQTGAAITLIDLKLQRTAGHLRAKARFRSGDRTWQTDVTDAATFRSSDDRVLAVDRDGRLTRNGPGEAYVFARYAGQSARLALLKPFPTRDAAPTEGQVAAAEHPLDRLWLTRLRELGLPAAPVATAQVLARRLYLDLVARLPSPQETRAVEANGIGATADALMATPEFAARYGRHLARWFEIPLASDTRNQTQRALYRSEHQKLVAAVRRGDSLHKIVERLLVRDRNLVDRSADPRDRAELAGRAFLGIRIGCARCHNSPVDRWEQPEHLSFSALFASPRPSATGGMQPGILFHPETRKPVAPALLPVPCAHEQPADLDLRESVAWFILRSGNGMFERNIANRAFATLLGTGLVSPTDDHRLSNPAKHEPLLDHLAAAASKGDLRALLRHIVTSRLYQARSEKREGATDAASARFFARRNARSMSAFTYGNAVARALGLDTPRQLPNSPLARQLAVLNSDALHGAIESSTVVRGIVAFAESRETALRDLFRTFLTRSPRPAEVRAFLPLLQRGVEGANDLVFALLASREFSSIR